MKPDRTCSINEIGHMKTETHQSFQILSSFDGSRNKGVGEYIKDHYVYFESNLQDTTTTV